MGVLGGWAISYERGTPVRPHGVAYCRAYGLSTSWRERRRLFRSWGVDAGDLGPEARTLGWALTLNYNRCMSVLLMERPAMPLDSGPLGAEDGPPPCVPRGRDTRQEDVEGSPTQSRISPSIQRTLRISTGPQVQVVLPEGGDAAGRPRS